MPRYHYRVSYHNQTRSARRTKRFIIAFCTLLFVGIAIVAIDLIRSVFNKAQPTSQEVSSSVQAASVNIFRTEYFQFQASPTWREVANESSPGRYVYRSYRGNLLEEDLIIEVNAQRITTSEEKTNRVLAVNVDAEGRLTTQGGVSENCNKVYPADPMASPKQVKMNDVTFICNPNSSSYQVVAGVTGGTNSIEITRNSGGSAAYFITFNSYKFTPDTNDLLQIVNSFQSN